MKVSRFAQVKTDQAARSKRREGSAGRWFWQLQTLGDVLQINDRFPLQPRADLGKRVLPTG